MTELHLIDPTLENYYRGIILFGDNTATYKFALGKTLLELATKKDDFISLEELAEPFSAHLVEHLTHSPKQITRSSNGKFIFWIILCIEKNYFFLVMVHVPRQKTSPFPTSFPSATPSAQSVIFPFNSA